MSDETISERAEEISGELSAQEATEQQQSRRPPPELVEAVRQYYVAEREDLLRRVGEIEKLLGFIDIGEDIAVRVAKLESFTGANR